MISRSESVLTAPRETKNSDLSSYDGTGVSLIWHFIFYKVRVKNLLIARN